MRVRLQLFDSRVARRIFGWFLIASLVPLLVLATWLLQRVGAALETQASDQLASFARIYGRITLDRLSSLSSSLASLEELTPANAPTGIPGLAALARSANTTVLPLVGDWGDADIGFAIDADKPTLALRPSENGYDVILARRSGSGPAVLGRVDPHYVGVPSEVLCRGMEACVLGRVELPTAIQCTAPLPAEAQQSLRQARLRAPSGQLSWSHAGEQWLAAYWELFLPSHFAAEPWTIVISQPRAIALESLSTFKRVVAQAALLTLALIVLLASAQIRRTLNPLKELLAGTRRIAAQDFATPVRIENRDEFGALGSAVNSMAEQLDHQFSSLRALADIDRLILQTAAIETVLETLLLRLRTLVPHGEHVVLIVDGDDPEHGRIYRASGVDPVALERVKITAKLLEWLGSAPGGRSTSAATLQALGVVLGRWPSRATVYTAPLFVGDAVTGALLTVDTDAAPFTLREMASVRELTNRVAVAIAAGQREAELFRRAHFDSLTGLPNRELLDDRLHQAVAQAHRDEQRLAVLFLDLDGFKEINDTLGHRDGDELLKETGLRLAAVLRDADTVARLGGDEYALVLPHIHGPLEAEAVAIKAIEGLKRPFLIGDHEVFVNASVGIALFPEDGDTADELLRRADMAMYSAKDAGKACHRFFAHEMDEQIQERHTLYNDLRRALRAGEFFLVYQPQREFATRRVVSAEALLRWRHPQRGLISPGLFIPLLEETGLINEVGTWVLQTALADLVAWRKLGLPFERIAVNIAARQLLEPGLSGSVLAEVAAAGLEGEHLEIEITEASIISDLRVTNDALSELARHGVRIALDDFGTGYSSLAYLNELVFDALKIDRAFVSNLPAEKSVAIVKAIIAVANTLGKIVVAEGIETEVQYRKLAALGCDLGQGYLLSRPLEAPALIDWMQALMTPPATGDSTSRIWRANFSAQG